MSIDYAAGLSHCDDLGVCGLDELFDKPELVRDKVSQLAELLRQHRGSCVVHVGAGLSTAAGIPDFRGKRGVWTKLQQQQQQQQQRPRNPAKVEADPEPAEPDLKLSSFDEAEPTLSHNALKRMCELGLIRHIISQNVDGLFLKSNLERRFISELHGDFYLDECTKCRLRFVRATASPTMRLTRSRVKCPRSALDVSPCKGHLRDTILDWESPIPYNELRTATKESKSCDLHICIGTSLQLSPSKDLVCKQPGKLQNQASKKRLVVINLQPIKYDEVADIVIHYKADEVMTMLAKALDFEIPQYSNSEDPTKDSARIGSAWLKS